MEHLTVVYQERSGQSAAAIAEALVLPPECGLSPDAVEEVFGYEHDLFHAPLGEEFADATVGSTLRGSKQEDVEAPSFFARPFMDGRIAIEGAPEFTAPQEVYGWLAGVIDRGTPAQQLLDWSQASLKYYTDDLAAELVAGTAPKYIDPLVTEARSLAINPDETLGQLTKLERVRDMVRAKHVYLKELGTSGDAVRDAKLAVLEVYIAKVNDQLADYAPRISYIQEQANLTGNSDLWLAAARALPTWEHQSVIAEDDTRRSYYRRLDYVRHGMGQDAEGRPHQVAQRLWELASAGAGVTIESEQLPQLPEWLARPFTTDEKKKLDSFMLSKEQVRALAEEVLRRADKLSASDPYAEGPDKYVAGRKVRASDGAWQAVFNPSKNTFMVDGLGGVYLVPPVPQSLTTVLTVGGSHEFEHVNQSEADQIIGRQLLIAGIKGKRVSPLREGGAMAPQRAWTAALFGEASAGRPLMTYAGAISELAQGRSLAHAAAAFYRVRRERTPGGDPLKAAKEAADRVVRLRRMDGVSSQPMAYAEDQLLADSLQTASPAARSRAAQVTCLDLPDQLRLHRYGLLPVSAERTDFMSLLLDAACPYIEEALQDE